MARSPAIARRQGLILVLASIGSLLVVPSRALAAPTELVWETHYNGPASWVDSIRNKNQMAVSPDGSRVYVTGGAVVPVSGGGSELAYATIAYNAASGESLWTSIYHPGSTPGGSEPSALALSADGSRVFVTGKSFAGSNQQGIATVAYEATSGNELWASRFDDEPTSTNTEAAHIAVSPDGSRVFVTGDSGPQSSAFVTLAYSGSSGAQLWRTYSDESGYMLPSGVGANPAGDLLFVTGAFAESGSSFDYDWITYAYSAATGNQVWKTRRSNVVGPGVPRALAVSDDGLRIVVVGSAAETEGSPIAYAAISYVAATGAESWSAFESRNGVANDVRMAGGLAYSTGTIGGSEALTTAHDGSGNLLWRSTHAAGPSGGNSLAMASDGQDIFVVGTTEGGSGPSFFVLSYSSSDGSENWDPYVREDHYGTSISADPLGNRVYAAGYGPFSGGGSESDFLTVALSRGGGPPPPQNLLVGLGDSVAAGWGLGFSAGVDADHPTGDNASAYPHRLAAILDYSGFDYAIGGACAARLGAMQGGRADPRTPTSCSQSVLNDELPYVGLQPEIVTITVGADDIQFVECFKAVFQDRVINPCLGKTFRDHLIALGNNLSSVLQRIRTLSPNARVFVTQYYNPLPGPAVSDADVCLLYDVLVLQRSPQLLATPTLFRQAVRQAQTQTYLYAANILAQLNETLQRTASAEGAQTVPLDFTGHDLCHTLVGGTIAATWVYGPKGNISATWRNILFLSGGSFNSNIALPDSCPDQSQEVQIASDSKVARNYSYFYTIHSNCAPHPTAQGQAAIANAIAALI